MMALPPRSAALLALCGALALTCPQKLSAAASASDRRGRRQRPDSVLVPGGEGAAARVVDENDDAAAHLEAISSGRLRTDDKLVMTRRGARQPPSRLGLAVGGSISVEAAMRAVAIVSANDVAVALAERVGGGETAFVRAMNRRAIQLGMKGTRFENATGLAPSGGVTTARDMSILARHIIHRYPERYKLFSARSIRWGGQVRQNHSQLLGRVRGVDGVKTGYTVPAGYNLAASSLRHGRRVIVVVLGSRTAAARDLLVSNLLESGFSSPAVGEGARVLRAGGSLPHNRR